jgi:hypothetical protein
VPSDDLHQITGRGGGQASSLISCRLGIDSAGNLRQAGDGRVLARRSDGLLGRRLVDIREAHPLHGVEVIEIAPEFVEPMRGGQRIGMVAQMVLAELAGVVAEIA